MAFDMGTTTVAACLIDLVSGKKLTVTSRHESPDPFRGRCPYPHRFLRQEEREPPVSCSPE